MIGPIIAPEGSRGTFVGRPASSVDLVSIAVLLRLLREPLVAGRLVGEAELVDTGERTVVRDAGQLIAYLRDRELSDGEGHPKGKSSGPDHGPGRSDDEH